MTKKTYTEQILDAIKDLHAQEQIATRETLADLTGLKQKVIDDAVSCLIDSGLVHRVQRGVFVPAPEHRPARLISITKLPCGIVKLEIGDDNVVTLTPREARNVATLMVGDAMQFSTIELGHQAAHMASELSLQLKIMRKELNDVKELIGQTTQPAVAEGG